MDVSTIEGQIAGTLVEHSELAKDGKQVQVSLCDDGAKLEVALTYVGVGTRVLYQGEQIIAAGRVFNDAVKLLADEGFTGNTTMLDPFDLSETIIAGRLG